MVSIFMCGISGSGKTDLCEAIRIKFKEKWKKTLNFIDDIPSKTIEKLNIKNVDELNNRFYYNLQETILREQCVMENNSTKANTISDHSIIDCITHTHFYLGPDASKKLQDENPVQCKSSILRYQSSLVVLLAPHTRHLDEESEKFYNLYTELLHSLKISYLKLCNSSTDAVIIDILKAVEGVSLLETSNLNNYSSKQKKEDHRTTDLSFFIKKPKKPGCICIRTITIKEHEAIQSWTIEQSCKTNRFIGTEENADEHLIVLDFDINVRSTVVQKMLLNGVTVNGKGYSFLGCSPMGLKDRTCYMWEGTQRQAEEILKLHGNFDQNCVSKRMSRISLLFTGVKLTGIKINRDEIVEEPDICVNEKCFTDGCGGINSSIAQEIFQRIKDPEVSDAYLPSVFQIRLQGYKGTLVHDSSLRDNNLIKVRPSMKKFDTERHPELCVCDYSKPHTFGHLNKQFILLLSGLGIPDDVFLQKQAMHLDMVQNMGEDPEKTVTVMQWQNKFEVSQNIIGTTTQMYSRMPYTKDVAKSISFLKQKLVSKVKKLNILIPKSRNIFGVCDPSGTLEYGQCFLRITVGQQPKTIEGQVVVIKNPCYLLGDIRVLNAVTSDFCEGSGMLNGLVDCIVFPTKGKRPHPDEIAGSDLDGDTFFVTWDESLIPLKMKQPYDYTSAKTPQQGKITSEKMIHYFSKQNGPRKLTGLINKYFLQWADLKGVQSEECERLGILFSRNIDAAKTGEKLNIPDILIPPTEKGEQKYVWQKMYEIAGQFKRKLQECVVQNKSSLMTADLIQEKFVIDILKEEFTNISEYDKFRFAWKYMENFIHDPEVKVSTFLDTFVDHINFGLFSREEKQEAFSFGIPAEIIENALHKSKILSHDDLAYFNMQTASSPWKFYFRSDHAGFDWAKLLKALTSHDRVFLLLKIPDQVTIALHFLVKSSLGEEQPVSPGTISGYFYSRNFGYRHKYTLGPNYVLDLSESTLQLYRDLKKNLTFIWLKASDCMVTKESRKSEKTLSDELLYQVSVDLLRFNRQMFSAPRRHPLVNKVPFATIEVFVQSDTLQVPYFDTVDGNFLEPVTETEDFEVEDDQEDFVVDFSKMISDSTFEIQILDEEAITTALEDATKELNLLTFKILIHSCGQSDKPLPDITADLFIHLLQSIVLKAYPNDLPEKVGLYIEEITVLLLSAGSLKNPCQILHLGALLCKLKFYDLAAIVAQRESNVISISSFLDIITKWDRWWHLDVSISMSIINQIRVIRSGNRLEGYIYVYGKLQLFDLLGDFGLVKERFVTEKADFSISNLKIEKERDFIAFHRVSALSHNPRITKGQFVAITRQMDFKTCPDYNSSCCIASVESVSCAPVRVTVNIIGETPGIVADSLRSPKGTLWRVDLLANVATHTRVTKALRRLLDNAMDNNPIINFLIHPGGHPTGSELYQAIPFDCANAQGFDDANTESTTNLNEMQRKAVSLSMTKTVSLIQGPPGTGKTTVVCEIVKHAHQSRTVKKILVVAETNIAVDNIVKKLRKDLPFDLLRMGNEGLIDVDIYDLSLQGQLRTVEEQEAEKTMFQDKHGDLQRSSRVAKKIIHNSKIILTTCAGSGDPILDSCVFDLVIVDEATQTKETTLLCSLVKATKHLVLIGDPNQLGPTITGLNSLKGTVISTNLAALIKTLFHRLYRVLPTCNLDTQYRMHSELMKYPSEQFYDNKLKSGVSFRRKGIVFPWPNANRPLCFLDINNGRERNMGNTMYNSEEAIAVQDVLDVILNVGEDDSDKRLEIVEIGVLTPYQGQIKEITNTIHHKVEVRSIDGFQGREKEVIIVSCVRTNSNRSLDFLEDEKRLNVMLTRAKRGLIVIGNESALSSSTQWKQWLNQAPRLNSEMLQISSQDRSTFEQGRNNSRGRYESGKGSSKRGGRSQTWKNERSGNTVYTRSAGNQSNTHRESDQELYNRKRGNKSATTERYKHRDTLQTVNRDNTVHDRHKSKTIARDRYPPKGY